MIARDIAEALASARSRGDVTTARAIGLALGEPTASAPLLHLAGLSLLQLGEADAALACLERAADTAPSAAISNDLGVALQRLGRFDDAIAAYGDALMREPEKADAHLNLANALLIVGEAHEAQPHAEFAAAALADHPAALALAALIEGIVAGFDRTLTRLAQAGDDEPAILEVRVFALRRLERFAEALAAAETLRRRRPADDTLELLAACRRETGAHREALALLDALIDRTPNAASALALAGDIAIELGEMDAAAARFRAATAADPGSVAAWAGRARLERFAPGDPAFAHLETLLVSPRLAAREERILLSFTLGNAYLAAGDEARAFGLLAEGNRLKRAGIRYDVGDDERHMAAIAQAFDAATVARLRAPSTGRYPPIIIVGLPRSGTTLVEQILASFPGVHGAGETFCARRVIEAATDYPAGASSLSREDAARLGAAYADALRAGAPEDHRVVDKMPSNVLYAGLLHAMLPDAKLVLCTRDPLDNGLSLYTELFAGRQDFAYDLTEIGRYTLAHRRLSAHWRATLPPHALLEVAYEDLIDDFEPTVRRLAAFCGLPWNDAALRFWETPRTVTTASRIAVRRPLFRSSLGRGTRYAAYLEPLVRTLGTT